MELKTSNVGKALLEYAECPLCGGETEICVVDSRIRVFCNNCGTSARFEEVLVEMQEKELREDEQLEQLKEENERLQDMCVDIQINQQATQHQNEQYKDMVRELYNIVEWARTELKVLFNEEHEKINKSILAKAKEMIGGKV